MKASPIFEENHLYQKKRIKQKKDKFQTKRISYYKILRDGKIYYINKIMPASYI